MHNLFGNTSAFGKLAIWNETKTAILVGLFNELNGVPRPRPRRYVTLQRNMDDMLLWTDPHVEKKVD